LCSSKDCKKAYCCKHKSLYINIIILDEADAMTNDAQFALRRIIEKYTRNARFCFICNYVSKIIPALQSRCTRFRFAPLQQHLIKNRLIEIADKESVNISPDGINAILSLSGGDMRRVLNLLQATAMSSSSTIVDEKSIYLTSGAPLPKDITIILELLMNTSFSHAYETITKLCTLNGYALADVIKDLTTTLLCLDMDSIQLSLLLDGMSTIEHRLAFGTSEKIQIASLVGVFVPTRHQIKI
jgi:replication factor C subunit 3/5